MRESNEIAVHMYKTKLKKKSEFPSASKDKLEMLNINIVPHSNKISKVFH